MCPLDVERSFEFPSSGGILRRFNAAGKNFGEFAAGKPNWLEKIARSVAALASSKASTIAITLLPPDGLRDAVVGLQPATRVETRK